MPKVAIRTLDNITNNSEAATLNINNNFKALQEAIENTISRDGTVPNYMDAALDMNSNRIINAADPVDDNDLITKKYFDENVGEAKGAEERINSYLSLALEAAQKSQTFSATAVAASSNADEKADEASQSAAAALVSEQNAKASELAAASSKQAASNSADAAYVSEQNAKTSETIASDSRIAASQSASAAASSASSALSSKASAASSASAAEQSSTSAQSSADAAAQSEQSAAASAETALEAAVKATIGNIGDIQFTIRSDVPNGSVWCDGTEYSKAEFPDVYALLVSGKLYNTTYETFNNLMTNHGSCGLFALDTVNEKFKVPSLNSIALEAAQTAAGFLAESLPQHTHQYQHISGAAADWTGNSNAARNALGNFTTGKADNPTYQDNAKVKTDRVVYRAYVVMYTGETEVSNGVVSEILDSCARKDLSNVPAEYDYVVESGSSIAGNQTAHYKLFKSGLLIQWGQLETISGNNTVTLPKPFADTSYQVFHGISNRDFGITGVSAITMTALNKTTSNWLLKEASVYDHDWMAIGQGATE